MACGPLAQAGSDTAFISLSVRLFDPPAAVLRLFVWVIFSACEDS